MNYRQNYIDIIKKAKSENRKKLNKLNPNYVYYEIHHILPKSLFPLWAKRDSNLVLLTSREHFLVHYLLTKIFNTKEMWYAWWKVSLNGKLKISSRQYEKTKVALTKIKSDKWKGNQYGLTNFKGKHHTVETKQKISNAHKGKKLSEEQKRNIGLECAKRKWYTNGIKNYFRQICPEGCWLGRTGINIGRQLSETAKQKIGKANTGRVWTKEQKLKLKQQRLGKTLSKKAKLELSNRKWYNNGKSNIFTSKIPPVGFVKGRLKLIS